MPDLCKSSLVVHMYSEYCTCMGPLSRAFPLHFLYRRLGGSLFSGAGELYFQKKKKSHPYHG